MANFSLASVRRTFPGGSLAFISAPPVDAFKQPPQLIMQRLRREWMQAFSGESNKSPFFAGNNTKATLLTQTAKDMEWLAQQRLSQEEISATFGVPLVYLNNFDRATYENWLVVR